MKHIISTALLLYISVNSICAQQTKEELRSKAKSFTQQGNLDAAVQVLDAALLTYPNDPDLLKDEIYVAYLNRDYAKALDLSKTALQLKDADEETYQMAGLNYKAIADYKGADKLYKEALKKFPSSGTLYSEYGDMLADNKNEAGAIKQWEKGIQVQPSISSNYYHAAKYYAKSGNILWGLIYAEIFVNTESFTQRTAEVKTLLANGYSKLIQNKANIANIKTSGSAFENAVLNCLVSTAANLTDNISVDDIAAFRSRFIIAWNNRYANDFPYKLFQYQQMLMQEGYSDAYNWWIFGADINNDALGKWTSAHANESYNFKQFQRSYLFKMPAEQYYLH